MAENLVVNENAVITGRKKVKGKERPTRKVLRRGEIYSSDDPIVKGREHLFRPVETATAVPGERRSVGRGKRKSESASDTKPPAGDG